MSKYSELPEEKQAREREQARARYHNKWNAMTENEKELQRAYYRKYAARYREKNREKLRERNRKYKAKAKALADSVKALKREKLVREVRKTVPNPNPADEEGEWLALIARIKRTADSVLNSNPNPYV